MCGRDIQTPHISERPVPVVLTSSSFSRRPRLLKADGHQGRDGEEKEEAAAAEEEEEEEEEEEKKKS